MDVEAGIDAVCDTGRAATGGGGGGDVVAVRYAEGVQAWAEPSSFLPSHQPRDHQLEFEVMNS